LKTTAILHGVTSSYHFYISTVQLVKFSIDIANRYHAIVFLVTDSSPSYAQLQKDHQLPPSGEYAFCRPANTSTAC